MRGGALNYAWKRIIRDEIWTEQGCRCFYCKSVLKRDETTLDHKTPQKLNGRSDRSNYVVACEFCNLAKGSMHISLFKKIITNRSPQVYPISLIRAVLGINKQADRVCRDIAGYAR